MEKTCNTCTQLYCKGKGTFCDFTQNFVGKIYEACECDIYSANYNIGAEVGNITWWNNLLNN